MNVSGLLDFLKITVWPKRKVFGAMSDFNIFTENLSNHLATANFLIFSDCSRFNIVWTRSFLWSLLIQDLPNF